jgi:hypothetical protein
VILNKVQRSVRLDPSMFQIEYTPVINNSSR